MRTTQWATTISSEELSEILACDARSNYIIAGQINLKDSSVLLCRGNLEVITVPWSWFRETNSVVAPEFLIMELIDFGQTVKLGKYEVAVDTILYAFDAKYRMHADDKTMD